MDVKQLKDSCSDDWEAHKDDIVWRRFWALWELRRKWNWANWFYKNVDRANDEVVATIHWNLMPGPGYMKLCLWIALLRSVHEGITENLDSYSTPQEDRIHPKNILPPIPETIQEFPAIPGKPFRDFRNAIFHCQWSPTLAKFKLDDVITKTVEKLHVEVGNWLNTEFRNSYIDFVTKYKVPCYFVYDTDGKELMPEIFY